jgi:transposase
MKKQHVTLSDTDRKTLEQLLSRGTLPVKKFKRATALLELDRGKTLAEVATTTQSTYPTVAAWRDAYNANGLTFLDDAPRSGRPNKFNEQQRAKITALAASEAPPGHTRWSVRLLTEKVIESGICDTISTFTVHDILKKAT